MILVTDAVPLPLAGQQNSHQLLSELARLGVLSNRTAKESRRSARASARCIPEGHDRVRVGLPENQDTHDFPG